VPVPVVLFEERATGALLRGHEDIAELLALTLGPAQGFVLNHRAHRDPELLEDSASAAQRIIGLPDRASNIGAMLMREAASEVHRRAGDGVATMAVLSQAILRGATRYVRAGGHPMAVKRGVEGAAAVASAALARQSRSVSGEEDLTRLAQAITGDAELSLLLGEMLDVLGPAAHITVEDYEAPYLERAYVDGGRWRTAIASPYFITDAIARRAVIEDCRVALYAGRVESVDEIEPLLTLIAKSPQRRLLLVVDVLTRQALTTVVANHDRGAIKALAVEMRLTGEVRASDYADLSLITGAGVLGPAYGRTIGEIEESDLGLAQRAESTSDELLVRGGGGSPAARRAAVDGLRGELGSAAGNPIAQDGIRSRMARLVGGAGVLKIGAHTTAERESRHQKAEKAIRALRIALGEGAVPGGGAAFLWAIDDVRAHAQTMSGDEREGALILADALEEPCRRIVRNRGGFIPAAALAELHRAGPGHSYDVLAGRVVSAREASLEDPLGVSRAALEVAVSGAMSLLTVAVMVLRRQPSKTLGA
jgi:chaperonin GroEL